MVYHSTSSHRPRLFLLMLVCLFMVTITISPSPVSCISIGVHKQQNGAGQGLPCKENEREALLTLKAGLRDNGGLLQSWSADQNPNCCNWNGVTCSNQTGHVLKLNLQEYFLVGEVSSSLLELKYLEYLDLSHNGFKDSKIPAFLGSLEQLRYLNLSSSNFSNTIPPHLGNLSTLHYLDLSWNNLGGQLPASLGNLRNLEYLNLRGNILGGPLPASLGNLSNLAMLNLRSNEIEGGIPATFGYLCKLRELTLQLNKLEGAINEFIDGFARRCSNNSNNSLEYLYLGGNRLLGTLPSSLGSFPKLMSLELSYNSFWGSIPTTIGSLTSLKVLILNDNQMNGTITEVIGQLSELEYLDLSNNHWHGLLTESHLQNLTKLQVLRLSSTLKGNLVMDVKQDWLPPFTSLNDILLDGVKMRSKKFPQWIQTQRELQRLSLRECGVSDSIPDEFWKSCTRISALYLSNNAISIKNVEAVSPDFLSMLRFLYLDNNDLSGDKILSRICKFALQLVDLDMSSNSMSGKIPTSISEFRYIRSLRLRNNAFTGELTPHHWEDMELLEVLDLSNNSFTGELTGHHWENMRSMAVLDLSDNSLIGEIPTFRSCIELRVLNFGGNKLTGNIPPGLVENHPRLVLLALRGNMLSGIIPPELCLLSGLQILDLAHNSFQGIIPQCLGKLSVDSEDGDLDDGVIKLVVKGREYIYSGPILKLVRLVDLSHNNLSGKIPESLMNFTAMQTLNLSMNHLTGEIPSNIGDLGMLESLDFSQNQLSGPIPQSFSSLSFLNYLNLSHNNFSGIIPSSRQLQTLENSSSYDGNPLLCGLPLPTKCPGDGTPKDHKGGDGKRRFDLEEWGFILSLLLGFFVGFWGVCGSLVIRASWREAYFGYIEGIKDKIIVTVVVNVARLREKMRN